MGRRRRVNRRARQTGSPHAGAERAEGAADRERRGYHRGDGEAGAREGVGASAARSVDGGGSRGGGPSQGGARDARGGAAG